MVYNTYLLSDLLWGKRKPLIMLLTFIISDIMLRESREGIWKELPLCRSLDHLIIVRFIDQYGLYLCRYEQLLNSMKIRLKTPPTTRKMITEDLILLFLGSFLLTHLTPLLMPLPKSPVCSFFPEELSLWYFSSRKWFVMPAWSLLPMFDI